MHALDNDVFIEDDALIELIQRGDSRAFEALVERHYATIFKIAYRWCRNREDADDITQDACIRLGRGILRFRRESKFTTWLYRLVLNAAKDWHRKQARRGRLEEPLEPLTDVVEQPNAENRLDARRLLKEIDGLPDKEKEAVLLVFAEDMAHREAAEVLGCAESTISWRIHSARKRLGKALIPKCEEEGRG
jgi:RNA polymerase sigma-70 factor (ECF subfamily)